MSPPTHLTSLMVGVACGLACLTSCQLPSEPLSAPQAVPSSASTPPLSKRAPRVVATPESSELARQLWRVLWEGHRPQLSLAVDIDRAEEALDEGVAEGAFSLAEGAPSPQHLPLAQTQLWWASRADQRELSAEVWASVLSAAPNAPLQLCLRVSVGPLESAWRARHPERAHLLDEARASGRVPLFYSERELLSYLNEQPQAVALFDVARLRLFGAPLAPIKAPHERPVTLRVWYRGAEDRALEARRELTDEGRAELKRWEGLLRGGAHLTWLSDLGWSPP